MKDRIEYTLRASKLSFAGRAALGIMGFLLAGALEVLAEGKP